MHNNEKASRAKLFQPFDSLKGFNEFLRQKEKIIVEKKDLSIDECEELDRILSQVHKGQIIKIIYYDSQNYIQLEGMVSKLDIEYTKTIQIVDQIIYIPSIISMEITHQEHPNE